MVVNHNIASMYAISNLSKTDTSIQRSLQKLSSGLRINRSADDAAGLAISERMRSQISGFEQAKRNCADGISLIQTSEGALGQTQSIIQRMKVLAVQAANGTYSTSDVANLSAEITQLVQQVDTIATTTKFNGVSLLSAAGGNMTLQIGTNAGETYTFALEKADSATLGIGALSFTTPANCATAITKIDAALDVISSARANQGAYQNRLEAVSSNLAEAVTNLQEAESRIRDVDMAEEMANYSKLQVLQQAGVSMASQANQRTAAVLKLLG